MPLKRYGVLRGGADRPAARLRQQRPLPGARRRRETDWRIAINVQSDLPPSRAEIRRRERLRASAARRPQRRCRPAGATCRRAPAAPRSTSSAPTSSRRRRAASPDVRPAGAGQRPQREARPLRRPRRRRRRRRPSTPSASAGGPEPVKDKIFGFRPGNGVHDIHMNQGNVGRFVSDDGVWQGRRAAAALPQTAAVGRGLPKLPVAGLARRRPRPATRSTAGGTPASGGGVGGVAVGGAPGDASVRIVAALVNAVDSPEREVRNNCSTRPRRRSSSTAGRSPTATSTASRCRGGSRPAKTHADRAPAAGSRAAQQRRPA